MHDNMKNPLLFASLAGASLLASCSDNSLSVPPESTASKIIYSPANGALPVPNDLLFNGTIDATLNFPTASVPAQQPLFDALNALDGWSPTAPISFAFDADVDAATVLGGSSVRCFEVTAAVSGTTGLSIGTPVVDVVRELSFPSEYAIAPTSTSSFAIVPLVPLAPATSYMVVLTDGIENDDGEPSETSDEYLLASVELTDVDYPTGHPLDGLQVLVNAMEDVVTTDPDVSPAIAQDEIICAFQFTTQDVATVLGTAQLVANGNEAAVLSGIAAAFPGHPAGTDAPANTVPTATFTTASVSPTLGGQGDLYIGELTLPYYLTAAANATAATPVTDPLPLTEFWQARYVFPIVGGTETNLTQYNSLPIETGPETVPILVSLPDAAVIGSPKPAAGWPVVIFQHGITANRSSLIAIADTLNAAGFAAIAIDLPLHGIPDAASDPLGGLLFAGYLDGGVRERTFGLDNITNATGAPGADGNADPSGAHYINLTSLRTQRDNLRQAVVDLFALKKIIADNPDIDGGGNNDIDAANVHFLGMSLGAIVGTPFSALDASLETTTFNVPGAGIPRLLQESAAYGPTILAGLAAVGITNPSPEFDQFMFAAQTVIDTGEPLNFLAALTATTTPIFAQEVVGDGTIDDLFGLPDQVIPNTVSVAPLSGTEPMLALLGLAPVTGAGATVTSAGVARFTQGAHSSLLTMTPDIDGDGSAESDGSLNAATTEMQSQIASWLLSGGAAVTVSDPTVVQ